MEAIDLLKATRIELMNRHPFWGYLCLSLNFQKDDRIHTIGVSETGLCLYNEEFITKNAHQLTIILSHEISHLMLEHHKRKGKRDIIVTVLNPVSKQVESVLLFNISTDYAVNSLLREHFTLPPFALYDSRFQGKVAEEIYDILKDELKDALKGGGAKPLKGGFDAHIWIYDKEDEMGLGSKLKQDIRAKMTGQKAKDWSKLRKEAGQWATRQKSKGDVPEGLEREVDDFIDMRFDWRHLVRKAVVNTIRSNYSWRRPHKSYYSTNIYLPRLAKSEGIQLGVAVDTSGSISKEELTEFISLIKGICDEYQGMFELYLTDCDAEVYNLDRAVRDLSDFYEFCKKLKGGGGTDYRPIFEKIEEEQLPIKLLIILGDLYGDMPEEAPQGYEVVWLVSEEGARPGNDFYSRAEKIGEVVYLTD